MSRRARRDAAGKAVPKWECFGTFFRGVACEIGTKGKLRDVER